jgi:hypothetical protein
MSPIEIVFLQAGVAVLNALLVIGGWVVVHRLTINRETKKKQQESLEDFCEQVDKITTLARGFHMAKTHSPENAETLRCSLSKLPRYIKRTGISDSEYTHHLTAFRQAITRSNFESPTEFKKQEVASSVLREIDESGSELEQAVQRAYVSHR